MFHFIAFSTLEGLLEYESDKLGDNKKEIEDLEKDPREWRSQ